MEIKKYKKELNTSYALGGQLAFNLLEFKPDKAVCVFVSSKQKQDETYKKIQFKCTALNIPIVLNDKVFKTLSDKENCYLIAEFTKYTQPLQANQPHIVLVNPENNGNLGTILRSAAGFGITNIAIITPAADHFDPKTIRASMGAAFACQVQTFASFEEYQTQFSSHSLYPFMLEATQTLHTVKKGESQTWSLVFGAESSGLPDPFLKVGTPVKIEQSCLIDSFNLPIAVSVALYEFTKKE